MLLRGSSNFCLCTTWFLDLDYLVGFNRAWLHKEPKVSVLQANAQLAQKGDCWTWNQRLIRGPGSIQGVTLCCWNFLFSHSLWCQYWDYCKFRLVCEKLYWHSHFVFPPHRKLRHQPDDTNNLWKYKLSILYAFYSASQIVFDRVKIHLRNLHNK